MKSKSIKYNVKYTKLIQFINVNSRSRSSANQRKVRIQNLKLVKSNNNIIINHAKTKKDYFNV